MSFGGIIFNFNPLNGHYLYPPFFPIQGLKREKGPFFGDLTTYKCAKSIPLSFKLCETHNLKKRVKFLG